MSNRSDLLDLDRLRPILQGCADTTGFTLGLIEHHSRRELFRAGITRLCRSFHRTGDTRPEECSQAARNLAKKVVAPGEAIIERCPNGMTLGVLPLSIQGELWVDVFCCGTLLGEPDLAEFKQRAENRGWDDAAYVQALSVIDVSSEKYFMSALRLIGELVHLVVTLRISGLEAARNEERLALALSGAGLGMWDWDIRTGEAAFNEEWARMLGYRVDEIRPRVDALEKVIHPDDWPAVDAALKAVADGSRTTYGAEYRVRTRSGEWRWVLDLGRLVEKDAEGRPVRASGTHLDITERKKTDDEKLRQLRHLESLERIDAVIRRTVDLETTMSDLMSEIRSLLQCDRAWLLFPCNPEAKYMRVLYEDNDPAYPSAGTASARMPVTRSSAKGFRLTLERNDLVVQERASECPLPDSVKPYDARSQMIMALRPRIGEAWLLGVQQCSYPRVWDDYDKMLFREIAGRVTETLSNLLFLKDLRKSEGRFRAITEHTSDCTVILSNDMLCHYASPALTDITGYTPEEVLGRSGFDFIHPGDRKMAEKYYLDFIEERKRTIHIPELQIRHRDGGWVPVECLATAMFDVPGVRGTAVTIRDVTDRKRADEERRVLEEKIRHTQKLESLGVLAGGVAHDFNNLLTGVLGNASLALASLPQGSPIRSYIEQIEVTSMRAAELCRQMLAYSGKGRLTIKPADMNTLVEEMLQMLKVSISKKSKLVLALTSDLPAVNADVTQLRQVIMNLITNASEAIGTDPGVIRITTGMMECDHADLAETFLGQDLSPGRYVYVEIEDTGCGMDRKTIEKIFDPFFTTKFTGRGLGLAAVLGIVRGHGGAINIDSEPHHGSSFRIMFPALDTPAADREQEKPADQTWRGSGGVMVVDDEEAVRNLAAIVLSGIGFDVVQASDGKEAIELLAKTGDDLIAVLLDLSMPELSGEEVIDRIVDARPDLRILVTSGYGKKEVFDRFEGHKVDAIIEKPYRPDDLVRAFRKVLEGD